MRLMEARAFSHMWWDKASGAIGDLAELIERAPVSSSPEEASIRTKAYYEYWHAVAWFQHGRYAESRSYFERLAERYPDTPWAKKASDFTEYLAPLAGEMRASRITENQE
jgi:outer membrane protein assembly factor BamD (BamD/ComL family)